MGRRGVIGLKSRPLILPSQFVIFAIGSEVAAAVGHFRLGKNPLGWVALMRIPLWALAYSLGLQLRKKAARLTPVELSNFLCYTVLMGGVGAIAPISFFLFETVSCIASDGLGSELCENTNTAATLLSSYVATLTAIAIAKRTVPRQRLGEGEIVRVAKRQAEIACLRDLYAQRQHFRMFLSLPTSTRFLIAINTTLVARQD